MHAMQCKILQPLGSFHHPFKFPCISANFQDFGIFLHLVSSFCGVDGTNLVISTQRGGPPQFYRTTGPLSTRFFLWQMHQDDAACIACSAMQNFATFRIFSTSFQKPWHIWRLFQDVFKFVPPGLRFLLCWWQKPCYFHTRGCPSQFYRSTGPLSSNFLSR